MKPLWERAVEALEEKKAAHVVVLDVTGKCSFADYIIICSGMSDRQIRAMAENVIEKLGKPFGAEGLDRDGGFSRLWMWSSISSRRFAAVLRHRRHVVRC